MKNSGTPRFRDQLFSWKMYPFWMFAAALVLSLSIAFWTRIPMPDMNRYCPMADAFCTGDWENAFHPRILPLVPVLGGVIKFLTGLDSFSSLKVLSSLSFALSIFPLYGIFRRFLEPVPTRIALLMTAFASMSLRYSSSGLRDSTKGLMYILCVYFLVRIFEEKRPIRNFLYLGVTTGLLALTRTECPVYAVMFLAAAFGLELFRGKMVLPWRSVLSALAALVILLPWLCYMNQAVGHPVPQTRYAVYLERILQTIAPSESQAADGNGQKESADSAPLKKRETGKVAAGPLFTPPGTLLSSLQIFSTPAEAEEEDEKIDAEEMEDNEGGFLGGNLLDNNNIGATTNIEDTVNSSNVSDFSFTNTSNGGYFAMYGHVEDDFNTEEEAFEGSAMLDGNQEETPSVLFYPDGSSQTIEVRLISTDEEDLRQVIICLNGITGLIEKRIYQVEEDTGEIDEESGEDLDTDQIDEEEKTVEFEEESLEDNFQRNQETGETNFGIKNVL